MSRNAAKGARMAQERRKVENGRGQGDGGESRGAGQAGGNPAKVEAGERTGRSWRFHVFDQTVGRTTLHLPPSPNARLHWAARRNWNQAWKEAAWWAAKAEGVPRLGRARIDIVNWTRHPRDRDNLYASMKPIVDGLALACLPVKVDSRGREIGLDDDKHLDLRCRNADIGKAEVPMLEIIVTELLQ